MAQRAIDPFSISAGTPIIPVSFAQPVSTPEELYALALLAQNDFKDEMRFIARSLKLDVYFPPIKTIERMRVKAENEKDGTASYIFDPLRVSFTGSTSKIFNALDLLNQSKNSNVFERKNRFAQPDPESGMRNAKIIYRLGTPPNSPQDYILVEIQLRHPKMHDAYLETGEISSKIRVIKSILNTAASYFNVSINAIKDLEKTEAELQAERVAKNLAAAEKTDLYKLKETRTFGISAKGVPFVVIEAPIRDKPLILVPNPYTGTYVTDYSLARTFNDAAFDKITPDRFIELSQELITRPALDVQL